MAWNGRAFAGAAALLALTFAQPAAAAPQIRLLDGDPSAGAVTLKVGRASAVARTAGSATAWLAAKKGIVTVKVTGASGATLATRAIRLAATDRATIALARVDGVRRLLMVKEPAATGAGTSSIRFVSLASKDALTLTADDLPLVKGLAAGRASRVIGYPALGPATLKLRRGTTTLASLTADLPGGVLSVVAAIPNGAGYRLVLLDRAAVAPKSLTAPSLTTPRGLALAETGDVVTCKAGTWSPATAAIAIEWLRDGETITGQTGRAYTLAGAADAEHEITCRETATVAGAGVVRRLASAVAALPALPASDPDNPPSVQGTLATGNTVTCDRGGWTGARSYLPTYVWLRDGAPIPAASGQTYALVSADGQKAIACRVTAENRSGTTAATSATVTPGLTPSPTSTPSLSGPYKDGTTITADDGLWEPPTATLEREWQRCDATGATCETVGTGDTTYVPGPDDVGAKIRVRVRGTQDGFASSWAPSNLSVPVAPLSTGAPALTPPGAGGGFADGDVLSAASTGDWNGATGLDLAREWQRSTDGGTTWVTQGQAATFTLRAEDVGALFRLRVSASKNQSAATVADSSATAERIAPISTAAPTISGVPTDDQQLTASSPDASWDGATDLTRTYRWLSDGAPIANATGPTYLLTPAEIGTAISVEVSASKNGSDAATATSAATALVSPKWDGGAVPAPTGTAAEGGVLQAVVPTEADWSGTVTPTTVAYRWRRCDELGASCVDIVGETGPTYTLTGADVDAKIRVVVRGAAPGGTVYGESADSAATPIVAPANTVAPVVSFAAARPRYKASGTPSAVGVSTGTWGTATGLTFTYRWRVCTDDTLLNSCANATGSGATTNTYTPALADVDDFLRVQVTATKGAASTTFTTDATPFVGRLDNTVAPAITSDGSGEVGDTLTMVNEGTWLASPAVTSTTYQWRWSATGAEGTFASIPGATGTTYTVQPAYAGDYIRILVTKVNDTTSGEMATSNQILIAGDPVQNTAAPSVTGTPTVGQTLTAHDGTWTGVPTPTVTRTWQRSSNGTSGWTDIPGETGTTYSLGAADDAKYVRIHVTGTNTMGSLTADSAAVGPMAGDPPANTVRPSFTGTERVGSTLTAASGTWTGLPAPGLAYQWQRSANGTTGWADIGGATSSSYQLASSEGNEFVRVEVTGTNLLGTDVGTSLASGRIEAAPVNTALPTISGTVAVGGTLTAHAGTWTGTPTPTFTYQWQSSPNGTDTWGDILGATGTTYVLSSNEEGIYVRVVVTGSNAVQSGVDAESAASSAVAFAPQNTLAPAITGASEEVGVQLTVSHGSWNGSPTPTYTYQWQRSSNGTSGWASIGVTTTTYTPVTADGGKFLKVVVTATNSQGAPTADSNVVGPIQAQPANTALPDIAGTAAYNQTLTADDGTWTGTPAPTTSRTWQRSSNGTTGWADILGETGPTYQLDTADIGKFVRVHVTAANGIGSNATADSAATAQVTGPPILNAVLPAVTGTTDVGALLTASDGAWFGFPSPGFTYQWQWSADGNDPWTDIGGATAKTYTLQAADDERFIRIQVTATNVHGSLAVQSGAVGPVVGEAPVNQVVPAVSGNPNVGQVLTCQPGTWIGPPAPTYAYVWEWFDGVDWQPFAPAETASTYHHDGFASGTDVRCRVTATNPFGTTGPVDSPGFALS